jgi:hypothetical protein
MNKLFFYVSVLLLFACHTPSKKENRWAVERQLVKRAANVSFIFPSKGFAYDNRNKLVNECLEAIKSNTALIQLPQYSDTITVQFLRSRGEMKQYTGMTPSGIALIEPKILYVVANADSNEVKPPIKHELMHMITMTTWGYPGQDSNWMNEGLAAYAENNCNGYNDEQIYRYLSEKNMLIPMEALATSFYKQPEMIAYHQAAYIVQYLLNQYGVEKFTELWTQGFAQFEHIYGMRFQQAKTNMDRIAKQGYPAAPAIDWNSFQKGCL